MGLLSLSLSLSCAQIIPSVRFIKFFRFYLFHKMSYKYHFNIFMKSRQKNPKARPHSFPRPLSAGGQNANKISRGFAKSFPQKIVLAKPSPHFAPPHCPNTWKAEPQKEKCPFHFRKKSTPAKNQKSKEHFFFLGLPSEARRWRGFRGAYDLV